MTDQALSTFPAGGLAVVVGAGGAIGGALLAAVQAAGCFDRVLGYSRKGLAPATVARAT